MGRSVSLWHYECKGGWRRFMSLRKSRHIPRANLASMGIYMFTWKQAARVSGARMRRTAASAKDFGKNMHPGHAECGRTDCMCAMPFTGLLEGCRNHRQPLGSQYGSAQPQRAAGTLRSELEDLCPQPGHAAPLCRAGGPWCKTRLVDRQAAVWTARLIFRCSFAGVTVGARARWCATPLSCPGRVIGPGARGAVRDHRRECMR